MKNVMVVFSALLVGQFALAADKGEYVCKLTGGSTTIRSERVADLLNEYCDKSKNFVVTHAMDQSSQTFYTVCCIQK